MSQSWMGCYSIAGLPSAVCRLYPFYTPGWRETMWGTVSCLRIQDNGRNWASFHRPSDLKSKVLTTTTPRPHNIPCTIHIYCWFHAIDFCKRLIKILPTSCLHIQHHFLLSIIQYITKVQLHYILKSETKHISFRLWLWLWLWEFIGFIPQNQWGDIFCVRKNLSIVEIGWLLYFEIWTINTGLSLTAGSRQN